MVQDLGKRSYKVIRSPFSTHKHVAEPYLPEHCKAANLYHPVWHEVSDRRGYRTAWSSLATVNGCSIPAYYWYDGQFIKNAREDAAEAALRILYGGVASPYHVRQSYNANSF